MTHLAAYVAKIYNTNANDTVVIEHVTEQIEKNTDDDYEQIQQIKIYTFSDGTQLQQTIEQDNQLFEVEACLESWIEYRVIHHSNSVVQPQKIFFDNHCREMHWIQYFNQSDN